MFIREVQLSSGQQSWGRLCAFSPLEPLYKMFIREKTAVLILSLFVIPKSIWNSFKSETVLMDALYPLLLWGKMLIDCITRTLCVPTHVVHRIQRNNEQNVIKKKLNREIFFLSFLHLCFFFCNNKSKVKHHCYIHVPYKFTHLSSSYTNLWCPILARYPFGIIIRHASPFLTQWVNGILPHQFLIGLQKDSWGKV